MTSFPESYLIFLGGLGWMLVAWSAVPEVIGRRAVWWLIAFTLSMALGESLRATLVQLSVDQIAPVESRMGLCFRLAVLTLLLEFLRCFTWPVAAPVSTRWLYAFPVGTGIIVLLSPLAVAVAVTQLYLTALIAACAWQLWRALPPGDPRRRGLRLAALGFAAFAANNAVGLIGRPDPGTALYDALAAFSAAMPWLMVLGFTEAFLGLMGTRSRVAWFFFVCLALTPFGGPFIQREVMPRIDDASRRRAVSAATESAAQFDSAAIARLAAGTATPVDAAAIAAKIAAIRTGRIRPDRVYLWTLRDGQLVTLPGTLADVRRPTGPTELTAPIADPAVSPHLVVRRLERLALRQRPRARHFAHGLDRPRLPCPRMAARHGKHPGLSEQRPDRRRDFYHRDHHARLAACPRRPPPRHAPRFRDRQPRQERVPRLPQSRAAHPPPEHSRPRRTPRPHRARPAPAAPRRHHRRPGPAPSASRQRSPRSRRDRSGQIHAATRAVLTPPHAGRLRRCRPPPGGKQIPPPHPRDRFRSSRRPPRRRGPPPPNPRQPPPQRRQVHRRRHRHSPRQPRRHSLIFRFRLSALSSQLSAPPV